MSDEERKAAGAVFYAIRQHLALSQEAMGVHLRCTHPAVSYYEVGKRMPCFEVTGRYLNLAGPEHAQALLRLMGIRNPVKWARFVADGDGG